MFNLLKKEKLEKFSSRKYKIILFWNAITFISLTMQFILSYLGKVVAIPVEIIVSITGILNAAYLGVNLAEKKVLTPFQNVVKKKEENKE